MQANNTSSTWPMLVRVVLKALILFALCNLLYWVTNPLNTLAGWSWYNTVLTGRERLPYSEDLANDRNMSLFSVRGMLASHTVSAPKADNEYRVLLLGDSTVWGWNLSHTETVSAYLNAANLQTDDGRRIVVYNVAYPTMSVLKDIMFLDALLADEPDAVVWWVSLQSVSAYKQTVPPLVQENRAWVLPLIERYDLNIDPAALVVPSTWDNTLIGQRRDLADLLRLQLYGVSWSATGFDHQQRDLERTPNDLTDSLAWEVYDTPTTLTADDLAWDVLLAGAEHVNDLPLLVVNAPIFVADGTHADVRYNIWYPRWAYDAYREQFAALDLSTFDMWDALPPSVFTDSPVHVDANGAQQAADLLIDPLLTLIEDTN